MKNSDLAQVFLTLDNKDKRELRKFIQSPYFNQREDLVVFFDFLEQNKDNLQNIEKEQAFKAVFKEKAKFDDLFMRHAMSQLLQLIKQFFAQQQWTSKPHQVNIDLNCALQARGLDDFFEKEQQRAFTALHTDTARNADYHHQKYQLELLAWDYSRRKKRISNDTLQNINDSFAAYIATNQLRHQAALLAQKNVGGLENQLPERINPFLLATEKGVETGLFTETPSVLLYYHSCRALQEVDAEQHFRSLIALLEVHWLAFPQAEVKDLYTLAINFCIKRINTGVTTFLQEVLNLYKMGLDRGILLENGELSRYTYNNVLLSAIALNEWDWALDFLEQQRPKLSLRERENAYRYNLAVYWFRRPDYDKVMEILRSVEFRDPLYNLDARRMLLRIYFEKAEWLALDSHLESFEMYLNRHRNIGYHRDLNKNLILFTKKIIKLVQIGEGSRARIKERILEAKYVAERAWLLEKLG
jgi:hypothetical protein